MGKAKATRPRSGASEDIQDPGIASAVIIGVRDTLLELGVSEARLGQLPKRSWTPGEQSNQLLERAAIDLDDPALALTLARRIPVGALGLLDYTTHISASVGQALARLCEFYPLITERATLTLTRRAELSELVLVQAAGSEIGHHWIEFSLAMINTRIKQAIGARFTLHSVEFRHAKPPRPAPYERFFGAPVHFGAERDLLRFESRWLAVPLRTASSILETRLSAKLAELRPVVEGRDVFLDRVRQAVRDRLDSGDAGQDGVLALLGTSRRTLQRQLNQRRCTFKSILDEVRRERAMFLLLDGDHPIAEISFQLGFSDPRAFFRAFRRWTGRSPGAVRARKAR